MSRLRKEHVIIAVLALLSLTLGWSTYHYRQAAARPPAGEALAQGANVMHLKISLRTVARQLDEVLAGERPVAELPRIRQEVFAAQRFASMAPWEPLARLNGALGLAQLDLEAAGEDLTDQEQVRVRQVLELAEQVHALLPERAMYVSAEVPWDEGALSAIGEAVHIFMNEPHRRMR